MLLRVSGTTQASRRSGVEMYQVPRLTWVAASKSLRLFHGERAELLSAHFHDGKALAGRPGEQPDVWIEDVECEDTIGSQVTPHRRQRREQIRSREQVQKRVAGDEDQFEVALQTEVTHVALDKRHRRIDG